LLGVCVRRCSRGGSAGCARGGVGGVGGCNAHHMPMVVIITGYICWHALLAWVLACARGRVHAGGPRRLWGRGGVCVPPMNALMFVVTRGGFLAVALAVIVVMYIGSVFGVGVGVGGSRGVVRCCFVSCRVALCCAVLCCVFALALAWCVRASVVAAAVRVRARMCSRGGVRARAAVQRRPLAPLHEHRGAERAGDRCAQTRDVL
jgi:hypothetical protein